jgi:hypothetical protein
MNTFSHGRLAYALLSLTAALTPGIASARVQRFAIIAGNDHGRAGEEPLRYAVQDAQKVYEVLRDLGGFEPSSMVLLRNEDANTFRATLIELNDRIRHALAGPDDQAVLFVYYSGHADADNLHLGGSDFPVHELSQLVSGSAATFRLLVVDACRSGALTRLKGGRIRPPFALQSQQRLTGSGVAFITASAATEDAQESDEVGGSLFTHAFVSGLSGAADRNGDGQVVLEEAYRYAYETTLRLTSRTRAGLQHPSFRYDVRGQGDLVLTRPHAHRGRRGLLHLPRGIGFLVMRHRDSGPLVAELGPHDVSRTLSLRPGPYFLIGRDVDHLLELEVEVHANQSLAVDAADFQRVAYARLVRKGGHPRRLAHALELGARGRSPLPNADRPCFGAYIGYALDFRGFGIMTRLGGCMSGFGNRVVQAQTDELDLEIRLLHTWDLPVLSLHVGGGAGAAIFQQRFETSGHAPSRTSGALTFHFAVGSSLEIGTGFYGHLDLQVQSYLFEIESSRSDERILTSAFALRGNLGLGRRF